MHDWLDFPEKLLISIGKIVKHVSIVRCPWYFLHALAVKNIQGSFLCIDVDYKKSACWKSLCHSVKFSMVCLLFSPPPFFFAYQKPIINGFTLDQWIAYGWYLNFVSKSLEIFITCWSHCPPPHSGVGGTACVFPKSPVKGYFSRDKVRPENCLKKILKKEGGGVLSLSLSLFGLLRNLKRGLLYNISVYFIWKSWKNWSNPGIKFLK